MEIILTILNIYAFFSMICAIGSIIERKSFYNKLCETNSVEEDNNKELLTISMFVDSLDNKDKLETNLKVQQQLREKIQIINKIKNNIPLTDEDKMSILKFKTELKNNLKQLMRLDILKVIVNVTILIALIIIR